MSGLKEKSDVFCMMRIVEPEFLKVGPAHFQINLIKFKSTKLKKAFDVWHSILLKRDFMESLNFAMCF